MPASLFRNACVVLVFAAAAAPDAHGQHEYRLSADDLRLLSQVQLPDDRGQTGVD